MAFNLSQMTVFDELTGSGEYDDMEGVEFLEFIVRVSYISTMSPTSDEKIEVRLQQTLTAMLALIKVDYKQPPPLADEEHIPESDFS